MGTVLQDGDDALMAAVGRGDERAFNRLVQRHAPRTYAVARRYLGNTADADDAAQEVFWRVWQSAGRWRPETARLGTWIYRITVNVCIDRKRTGRRQAETFADIEMPDATDETVGPEQRIAARQHLGAVLAGISALPDDQRMALILSVQQNLSNREIAAAMATSEGAVEQLLVRARRALRVIHRSLT